MQTGYTVTVNDTNPLIIQGVLQKINLLDDYFSLIP